MRYPNVNLNRSNEIQLVPYDEFKVYQYDKFPHGVDPDSFTTVCSQLNGQDNARALAWKKTNETNKICYSDLPIGPIAHPFAIYRSVSRMDQRRYMSAGPVLKSQGERDRTRDVVNETFRYSIRPKRTLLYSAINYINNWDY